MMNGKKMQIEITVFATGVGTLVKNQIFHFLQRNGDVGLLLIHAPNDKMILKIRN